MGLQHEGGLTRIPLLGRVVSVLNWLDEWCRTIIMKCQRRALVVLMCTFKQRCPRWRAHQTSKLDCDGFAGEHPEHEFQMTQTLENREGLMMASAFRLTL